jgi:hypothetical protein
MCNVQWNTYRDMMGWVGLVCTVGLRGVQWSEQKNMRVKPPPFIDITNYTIIVRYSVRAPLYLKGKGGRFRAP